MERNLSSIVPMVKRLCEVLNPTKRAGLLSFLDFRYRSKYILVFASKYALRSLLPLPRTMHSRSRKLISVLFNLTSSPIRMPVEDRSSMMALSLNVGQPSRIISICSSVKVSFMTDIVLTRLILRTGLLTIYSSSSSQEKKSRHYSSYVI